MADTIIPGAQALSEWFSPVGGLIIGCGEAAALVATHVLNGEKIDPAELTRLIQDAIANGQTVGSNHAQTAANVQWDLGRHGISSSVTYDRAGIIGKITSDAGVRPLILGVSNGSALPDESKSLRGHFVTLVGRGCDGTFLLADPNTQAATHGGFTRATLSQLLAALPFAAIEPKGTPVGSNPGDAAACGGIAIEFQKITGINICGAVGGATGGGVLGSGGDAGAILGQFYKGAALSLERAGFLLLALTIVAFGVLLLAFPALESGAKTAGKAAIVAA